MNFNILLSKYIVHRMVKIKKILITPKYVGDTRYELKKYALNMDMHLVGILKKLFLDMLLFINTAHTVLITNLLILFINTAHTKLRSTRRRLSLPANWT